MMTNKCPICGKKACSIFKKILLNNFLKLNNDIGGIYCNNCKSKLSMPRYFVFDVSYGLVELFICLYIINTEMNRWIKGGIIISCLFLLELVVSNFLSFQNTFFEEKFKDFENFFLKKILSKNINIYTRDFLICSSRWLDLNDDPHNNYDLIYKSVLAYYYRCLKLISIKIGEPFKATENYCSWNLERKHLTLKIFKYLNPNKKKFSLFIKIRKIYQ
jgi:hypothetical protein